MVLVFKSYIKRAQGTTARAVEVTEDNVEEIQTLWKRPEAVVGQMYVRYGLGTGQVMETDHFARHYRPRN